VKRSNIAAYSVTCKETGTLATPLPDLTIVDVRIGVAGRGQSAKALVRVRNIGAAGAPATLVRAQRQGASSTEAPVPALAAGDSHDVEVLMPAGGGAKSPVLFRVDPANAVQESHEGNNTHSQ
jgi:subtilase family serine protease